MKEINFRVGGCYVISNKNYDYNWITYHVDGKNNKHSICFYPNTEGSNPYLQKEASFGINYSNFGDDIIVRLANNKEKAWLDASIKANRLIPIDKVKVHQEINDYQIY